jgi:hypothetical protein
MGIWNKLEAGYGALQAGKQLADPHVWAQRANVISILTALVTSVIGLCREFGVDLPIISGTDIASIALGIGTLGTIVSSVVHTAANSDAGVRTKPVAVPHGKRR